LTVESMKLGSVAGRVDHARPTSFFSGPGARNWSSVGSDSSVGTPCAPHLALFHTIRDMMTVILRIDETRDSNPHHPVWLGLALLTYLLSIHSNLTPTTSAAGSVWHTGCPKNGCEGLRVLGTWIKPGWGLGIPEIGRTGIFSPRKYFRRGNQANFSKQPRRIRGK
jgi:hypothetical protein